MKSKKQIKKDIKRLEKELTELVLIMKENKSWRVEEAKIDAHAKACTINALKYVLDEN